MYRLRILSAPVTGEILCEAGQTITKEIAHSLEVNAVNEVVFRL